MVFVFVPVSSSCVAVLDSRVLTFLRQDSLPFGPKIAAQAGLQGPCLPHPAPPLAIPGPRL